MRKHLLFIALTLGFMSLSAQNFHWAKGIGGSGNDNGRSVANDAAGNIYILGMFDGTVDFDPGSGVFNLTSAGMSDIFISKLDANGNFVWAKSIGGTNSEDSRSITIDASGNVLATGYFQGTVDFDPGSGTSNLTSAAPDIFILKLDGNGNFVWANKVGGTGVDISQGIAADRQRNVYVTGIYSTTADFDPGAGTSNLTSKGSTDVFISKYDSMGKFVWAKSVGDSGIDYGNSIAVDSVGNVFVSGQFQFTVDFDPGTSQNLIKTIGFADVFIIKLNTAGNFVWAKNMGGTAGGTQGTNAFSITVNKKGQVYTTGNFLGTIDFDPGTSKTELTALGSKDAFVLKLENNGNFVWARRFGSMFEDDVRSIATDAAGNVYTSGGFQTTIDVGIANIKSNGSLDIFIMALDDAGNFKWAQNFGGVTVDGGSAVSVDAWGNVYTTGYFTGNVDFDPGTAVFGVSSKGGTQDAFVTKVSPLALGGIKSKAAKHQLSIFPNPSQGKFSIISDIQLNEIEVLNAAGQSILKMQPGGKAVSFEIEQSGVYFVKINSGNSVATKKILVK